MLHYHQLEHFAFEQHNERLAKSRTMGWLRMLRKTERPRTPVAAARWMGAHGASWLVPPVQRQHACEP